MKTERADWAGPLDGGEEVPGVSLDFLERSRQRYSAIVRAGALVLWRSDIEGWMTSVAGWDRLTGRPDEEALGAGFTNFFHPDDRKQLDFSRRGSREFIEIECRVLDREGRWRWVRGRGVLLPEAEGFPAEWVGTLEDIHEQRRALDRARYLADRDALTGLGNRRTLATYLQMLREKSASATVAMLDVRGFKAINDLHGHHIGDRFLVRLGQMLSAAAPPHSVCSRMGGDEFCVVVADRDEAIAMCNRFKDACREGVELGDLRVPMSFRAGVADADWEEPDPGSKVLRKADLALRRAKVQGERIVVHDAAMQAESDTRELLLRAIGPACRNNEFFLEYQPIIDITTGAIASYEALIRWQHPMFGRIEPSVFVHLAEQNGMIGELGRWVLSRACSDLVDAPSSIRLNLNVSARQFADQGFADHALEVARAYNIAPERITFELTESVNMTVLEGSDAFKRLREHGFRTVLDDFGTEYAVLSHISSGNFDGIKLSREFTEACCVQEKARLVLRHMVNLCNDLGMRVVAEGVETDTELDCLREQGVHLMQGYYFDRPSPELKAERLPLRPASGQ